MLFLVGSIILLFAGFMVFLIYKSPGTPKPFLDAHGRKIANSISEKIFLDINGSRQGMFIKGENSENPVILYLHGGMPDYFLTGKYPTGLEKDFTIVWWEQRGCGISYDAKIKSTQTSLQQLIDDTITLTHYLLKRFHKDKIYLMGHSGGTFIGVHVIDQRPELFNAYIGMSQMSNQRKSEQLAYEHMLKAYEESGNRKMAIRLKKMHLRDHDELPREYLRIRDIAMHELGIGTMRNMKNLLTDLIFPSLLFSEYTLLEKYHLWASKAHSGVSQNWNYMMNINLMESKNSFTIPVYFLQGRYDYTCSYDLAHQYFTKTKAPVKGFYTFENSAHCPIFEEPQKTKNILVHDVVNATTHFADKR